MRYIIILIGIIVCVPMCMSATITTRGCEFNFGLHSKDVLLTVMVEIAGGCYIFGMILFLPALSVLLVRQIRKIKQESNKLQHHGNKQNLKDIKNVKLQMRQLLIAIYSLIILTPNLSNFIHDIGTAKILINLHTLIVI